MQLDDETIKTLSCDIAVRPRDAAGVQEVMAFLLSVQNLGSSLRLSFDKRGAQTVESFVAAEKLCCTGLKWELTPHSDQIELNISASPDQLTAVQRWFATA
jgi:hypothetical protein